MTEHPGEAPRAGVEAARLLAAAQEWLRTSAPHLAPVDAEGQTCPCPLCRAVAGVRDADPDSVGRWVDSAVAAATAVLAQAGEKAAAYADASGAAADPETAGAADLGSEDDEGAAVDDSGYLVEDTDADDAGASDDADDDEHEAGGSAYDDAGAGRGVRRITIVEQDGEGRA